MKARQPNRKQMIAACDQLGPDDGLDPRFDTRDESQRPARRKSLQLCREVQRTLNQVLSGECADDLLRDLYVQSVIPAPSTARLLVTVRLTVSGETATVTDILSRLLQAAGRLRGAVAAAVRRRKAPDLVFQVLGC